MIFITTEMQTTFNRTPTHTHTNIRKKAEKTHIHYQQKKKLL